MKGGKTFTHQAMMFYKQYNENDISNSRSRREGGGGGGELLSNQGFITFQPPKRCGNGGGGGGVVRSPLATSRKWGGDKCCQTLVKKLLEIWE